MSRTYRMERERFEEALREAIAPPRCHECSAEATWDHTETDCDTGEEFPLCVKCWAEIHGA